MLIFSNFLSETVSTESLLAEVISWNETLLEVEDELSCALPSMKSALLFYHTNTLVSVSDVTLRGSSCHSAHIQLNNNQMMVCRSDLWLYESHLPGGMFTCVCKPCVSGNLRNRFNSLFCVVLWLACVWNLFWIRMKWRGIQQSHKRWILLFKQTVVII